MLEWVVTNGNKRLAGTTVMGAVNVFKVGFFVAFRVDYFHAVFAFGYGLTNLYIF